MDERKAPRTLLPGFALPDTDLECISAGLDPDAYVKELSADPDELFTYKYDRLGEELQYARDFMKERFPEGNAKLAELIDQYQKVFDVMRPRRDALP